MRTGSPKFLSRGQPGKWDTTGVLLDESIAAESVDLAAVFGNARPVEMEVGTGKGTFLLARAAARAELNFLGTEWARAYCRYAADRFRRAGLKNVRMLRADATRFVRDCLAGESLWAVHIYFPDPWPKRRHHRRRSVTAPFLADIHRVLKPGGRVNIVTDHLDYFRCIQAAVTAVRGFAAVPFPPMADREGEMVGTNFERKYIGQGRCFYHQSLMKYV